MIVDGDSASGIYDCRDRQEWTFLDYTTRAVAYHVRPLGEGRVGGGVAKARRVSAPAALPSPARGASAAANRAPRVSAQRVRRPAAQDPLGETAPGPRGVLIVGAGGGGDIGLARYHGAGRITALEMNRDIIKAMTGPLRDRGGRIYEAQGVEVVPLEARGYLDPGAAR